MPTHTTFKEITNINQSTYSDSLESNIIAFFNYGFLNIGGFFNVTIPQSGSYGGTPYKLKLAKRDGYTNGQVWEGFRKDWIWESGIECSTQPIQVSGVNVNNTFYPLSTTGAFAYKIDYPNGRIVFDSAISQTATVTCEYSHRYIQFANGDAPWWQTLQRNSFRPDNLHFTQAAGSGVFHIPPEQRCQLPSVVVTAMPNVKREGHSLGSLKQWTSQEVRFHILAETSQDAKFIYDTITSQWEKRIIGFDKNLMITNTGFPLNYDGSKAVNCRTYPDLVKPIAQGGFQGKTIRFESFRSWEEASPSQSFPCYFWTVAGIFETDLP